MANKTLKTIRFPGLTDTYTIPSEDTQNKVTSISSSSTDTQYPSAKATYDADQATLTAANSYTDTAIANAITTTLNTPV